MFKDSAVKNSRELDFKHRFSRQPHPYPTMTDLILKSCFPIDKYAVASSSRRQFSPSLPLQIEVQNPNSAILSWVSFGFSSALRLQNFTGRNDLLLPTSCTELLANNQTSGYIFSMPACGSAYIQLRFNLGNSNSYDN